MTKPAAGPAPASREMLLPLARKHRHLPSSPKTSPVTLGKVGHHHTQQLFQHDTDTRTSPRRNAGGTLNLEN